MEDLDTPNTRPGYCPECGVQTYWLALAGHWECGNCNWTGYYPAPQTNREEAA
jgi:ribosomal protein L37AE/L43A